jgi:pantoate--beta-alanine ligase
LQAAAAAIDAGTQDAMELERTMHKILEAEPGARVDYADIVDADTFEPVVRLRQRCYALLAVHIGGIRLIDNLWIEQAGDEFRVEL